VRIRSSTCSWGLARAGRRGTGSRRGTAGQGAGSGTARWGPRSSTLYPGTPTMTTRPAPVSSLRRRRRRPLGLRERDREQRAISIIRLSPTARPCERAKRVRDHVGPTRLGDDASSSLLMRPWISFAAAASTHDGLSLPAVPPAGPPPHRAP
jgi:hypothetical protein